MSTPLPGRRRTAVAVGTAVATLVILARLFWLQVLEEPLWSEKARASFLRTIVSRPARGSILDRKGRPLAISQPSFTIALLPAELLVNSGQPKELAALLGVEQQALESVLQRLRENGLPLFEPIPLKVRADLATVTRILEWTPYLQGVMVLEEPTRVYPQGRLAAHVLGYIGMASQADMERWEEVRPFDWAGKGGIERVYEPLLRGVHGRDVVEVDALGLPVRYLDHVPPQKGQTLVLTIDADLQREAEEALKGHSGAVVVLKPTTGEVLALASSPSFDPNWFPSGIGRERWRRLMADTNYPLHNRAIASLYPPGSVFKVTTAIAGLCSGKMTPSTRFTCGGGLMVGRRFFRCWRRHGTVNMLQAIGQSCDTYFYRVALLVGPEHLFNVARALGLTNKTGIDLPGESSGLVGFPDWKRARFGSPWFGGDTANMGIGQGFVSLTPLQMALLACAVANRGTVFKPHLLSEVRDPTGDLRSRYRPQVLARLAPNAPFWGSVKQGMLHCIHGPGGTATRLRGLPLTIAGKTGSAQHGRKGRTHSCFIAFAPSESPEVALAVIAEEAGHGSEVAVPIARRDLLLYAAFRSRGAPSPRPTGESVAWRLR